MKNKKYLLIGVISLVLIIIISILLFNKGNNDNTKEVISKDVYIVHYYYGGYVYDMKSYHNKIVVRKSEVIECIKAPCNPILVQDYSVTSKDEYRNTFKELVKDQKEVTIKDSKIDEKTKKVFSKIILDDLYQKESIDYKILDINDNQNYKTRGYYVEEKENKIIVTVAMGEKNTGGYRINIVKVNIIDDGAQIYYEEKTPSEKEIVTQAFTYPIKQVEFDKMPKYIMVKSLDTYEELERVN